jgi:4'-phosphopantetheinyl transferase
MRTTEVVIWRADHRAVRAEWEAFLDAGERTRLAAFHLAADRWRFLTGVALVRCVYARELGIHPAGVRLVRRCPDCDRPHGRPRLAGASGATDVTVSVSHSGTWVLVAAGRAPAIGVDVEVIDPRIDHLGLARVALHDNERAVLAAVPPVDRAATFTSYWVRKEAVVKATGDGLRVLLSGLWVSPPFETAVVNAWQGREHLLDQLHLRDVVIDAGHRAAVATLGMRAAPSVVAADAAELLTGQ